MWLYLLIVSIFLRKFLQWRSPPYHCNSGEVFYDFFQNFDRFWVKIKKDRQYWPFWRSARDWVCVVLNGTMGLFWRRFTFIGYYEVEQETRAKFVPQSNPIVPFDTISTQLHPVNTHFHPPNWCWQINDSYTK